MDFIDNHELLPAYKPDSEVKMEGWHPDWVKDLIMAQFRVETATPEGTFDAAVKVLDHFAEMGVNGLWLNPVYQRSEERHKDGNNGYGSFGPHAVDMNIGSADTNEGAFASARKFVKAAHERNIRIFFDIVVWGTEKGSDLVKYYPQFFLKNGQYNNVWGGYGYNWDNPEWEEWYVNASAQMVYKTGADGLRVDLEPTITGYRVFRKIRDMLYKMDRKPVIYSEGLNIRDGVYDFEQGGVGVDPDTPLDEWNNPKESKVATYYLENNIVNSVKTGWGVGILSEQKDGEGGKHRYYTYNICCHDSLSPSVFGDRVRIGYQAIFSPYIPMWWIGEEWNNPLVKSYSDVMFFTPIRWELLDQPENRAFYEDFKKMIRIRRERPEIFTYFPENHRDANICKVESDSPLQAYARFTGDTAVLILPNSGDSAADIKAVIPFDEMRLDRNCKWKYTELMNGDSVIPDSEGSLTVSVQPHHLAVIEIKKY